jgi:hypothetical protein
MTNEEMQRTSEFIVAQQAQFVTNMAALAAAQTHTDERLTPRIDIVREGRKGGTD